VPILHRDVAQYSEAYDRLKLGISTRSHSHKMPLLKSEWVEMRDPAPPRRRTHGGTGAGALALVKPLPPKVVAEGQALQGPRGPGHNGHRRADGLRFKTMSCAPSVSAGTASPIRNSKEPIKSSRPKASLQTVA
jgi:hypothetical protein